MTLPPRDVATLPLGPERVAGAAVALDDDTLGAGAGAGSVDWLEEVAHAVSVATTNNAKEVFMLRLPICCASIRIMLQIIFAQI
jgi:hypothetical protein